MHLMKSKTKYSSFLALLTLLSCGGGEVRQNLDDTSFRTSGVEQFFLPELPKWANYSFAGQCYKSSSFQYIDFGKVNASYQLTYPQIIELQGQYNERRESYFSSTAYKFLKPVEEASFFSNTLEQVRGGVKQFTIPNAPAVDLVWLEGYLQHNKLEELKKMAASGKFDERPPILFSSCLSRQRLNQWVQENGFADSGFFLLSAEWLSPFKSDNTLGTGLKLEISKLLNPGVKVRVLVPEKTLVPLELTF